MHAAMQGAETHEVGKDVQTCSFATYIKDAGAAGEAGFTGTLPLVWVDALPTLVPSVVA